jgi:cytochrome c-type biogenesis protein CcmH
MSRSSRSRLCALAFSAALCAAMPAAFAAPDHGPEEHEAITFEYVPGAAALEGKIIAPCCWNQIIDIHGSPSSTQLRVEIRKRLKNGETPEAIQQSIVDRYGEKVLAVKPGSKLGSTGVLLAIVMGAAGVFAFSLLRRWRDRSPRRKRSVRRRRPPRRSTRVSTPSSQPSTATERRARHDCRVFADSGTTGGRRRRR